MLNIYLKHLKKKKNNQKTEVFHGFSKFKKKKKAV